MNLDAIQTALVALLLTLLGDVPNAAVQWENEPRKMVLGPNVLLSWVSTSGVSVDERRWEDTGVPAPDSDQVPASVGWRRLVLQVAPEVTANARASAPSARAVAEILRTRLARESALAAFADANLGLATVGDVTPADYPVDGRFVSRCLFELTLNASSYDRDADGAVSSIESVDVTGSTIDDAAGAALPDAEQITGVLP